MIFEHRTYNILPGKMGEFTEVFGQMIVPLLKKYGAQLVGTWRTTIGQNNEFIYILGFENMARQELFWREFRKDDEFLKYQQTGVRVACVVSKILTPTSYSPLR